MKNFFIILLLTTTIVLGGCTKKIEKPIIFENFKINLETKYNYQEIAANIIPETPTIKQYIQDTQTGFANSIIIAKNILQKEIDLPSFAENNSKSITRKIIGSKEPKTKNFSFDCKENEIKGIIQTITIEDDKETQYLNQLFFVIDQELYGISTMTLDKREHKNLNKSIQRISCI